MYTLRYERKHCLICSMSYKAIGYRFYIANSLLLRIGKKFKVSSTIDNDVSAV